MSNAFESIAQGLREAIALNEGEAIPVNVFRPEEIDVGQLRRSLGLTQSEFAAKFCISLGTLRHWERGDRKPHGPALALLHVVAKEPQAVLRALA
jgi:putative transcriptional regulator